MSFGYSVFGSENPDQGKKYAPYVRYAQQRAAYGVFLFLFSPDWPTIGIYFKTERT